MRRSDPMRRSGVRLAEVVASRSLTTVRVDVGVIEVESRRALRTRSERIPVPPDRPADATLTDAFATSRLLRPGRSTHTRVLLETSSVVYATARSGIQDGSNTLPDGLRDGLVRAVQRRRVRGPATVELGPLARAEAARPTFGDLTRGRVGVIADRSNAAVTVLVVGRAGLLWGRSVPPEDTVLAVRLLIDRANGMLQLRRTPSWWCLHDVATDEDARITLRRRSEFAAATASELDGVPIAPRPVA